MPDIEPEGRLSDNAPRRMIGVGTLILLFTVAFALVVLAIGVIPVNRMLGRMVNPSAATMMWRNSMNQLTVRTAVAALTCWLALVVTRRGRGQLTGSGMLSLGAVTSGALAGAVDVALHKLLVRQMILAYHSSKLFGNAFSLGMTIVVVLVMTLLLISRRTRVVAVATAK